MNKIFDPLLQLKQEIIASFDENGTEFIESELTQFNRPSGDGVNRVWRSSDFRRAHIDVVDVRERHDFWVMHVCI
ncbi:hypothetical protein [Shewanella surugensis]|uniref:Uncharacterized protein n=1 Tax=Shewanella surugensis TaxID=212020 RepID=A0ABT0LEC2_9GAMM|nr:hypothetical protein [Shewanella surugensis]MCL1126005.1 hypothetical protein [Shewanella surugensis]